MISNDMSLFEDLGLFSGTTFFQSCPLFFFNFADGDKCRSRKIKHEM